MCTSLCFTLGLGTSYVKRLQLEFSKGMYAISERKGYPSVHVIKNLPSNPWELLNWQGVRRISWPPKLDVRFGGCNVVSFCERGTEVCYELKNRKVCVYAAYRSKLKRPRNSVCWCQE